MNNGGLCGRIAPCEAMLAGFPESGSVNQSAIHWDMICDLRQGGQATVDGEVFMKDGKIVV